MIKHLLIALLAVGLNTAPAKQNEPVAKIVELNGTTIVYSNNVYAIAVLEQPLWVKDVVATASKSVAVVEYENGCKITIEELHTHTIDDENCIGAVYTKQPFIVNSVPTEIPLMSFGIIGIVGVTEYRANVALSSS